MTERMLVMRNVTAENGVVEYNGSILVEGNVKQQAQIVSTGDVIVKGHVESSIISAGGNITVDKGVSGKMDSPDCHLIAQGNVSIQFGQGVNIHGKKNIQAIEQLAYSTIRCLGKLTVGKQTNQPDGLLFASNICAFDRVSAGIIGAVSGSEIVIDFSEGYNMLSSKLYDIQNLGKELQSNNLKHNDQLKLINKFKYPSSLRENIDKLETEIKSEQDLISWLSNVEESLNKEFVSYKQNAVVKATKEMYPGVQIILNNEVWESNKEFLALKIQLNKDQTEFIEIEG